MCNCSSCYMNGCQTVLSTVQNLELHCACDANSTKSTSDHSTTSKSLHNYNIIRSALRIILGVHEPSENCSDQDFGCDPEINPLASEFSLKF